MTKLALFIVSIKTPNLGVFKIDSSSVDLLVTLIYECFCPDTLRGSCVSHSRRVLRYKPLAPPIHLSTPGIPGCPLFAGPFSFLLIRQI